MAKFGVFQSTDSKRWFVKRKGLLGNIVPEASNLGKTQKNILGLSTRNIKGFKTEKEAVNSMRKHIKKRK